MSIDLKFSFRLEPTKFGKYLVFLIGGFAFLITFYFNGNISFENLISLKNLGKSYYSSYPYLTKIIFCGAYILAVSIFIPIATILTILSGVIFGLLEGTILSLFSSSLGATISFILVRSFFYQYAFKYKSKRFQKFSDNFKTYGLSYLFAARMTPIFPFFLVNIFMALMPIRISNFFFVSFLGMAPMTVIFVYSGTIFDQINSYEDIVTLKIFIILSVIGFFPFLLKLIFNKNLFQEKKLRSKL